MSAARPKKVYTASEMGAWLTWRKIGNVTHKAAVVSLWVFTASTLGGFVYFRSQLKHYQKKKVELDKLEEQEELRQMYRH